MLEFEVFLNARAKKAISKECLKKIQVANVVNISKINLRMFQCHGAKIKMIKKHPATFAAFPILFEMPSSEFVSHPFSSVTKKLATWAAIEPNDLMILVASVPKAKI